MTEACDGFQKFLLTGTSDTCDSQDLAAVGDEAYVVQLGHSFCVLYGKARNGKSGFRIHRVRSLDVEGNLVAYHHFREFLFAGLSGLDGSDVLALPENGYHVGDLHYFVELVSDEDDGFAVISHGSEYFEQLAGLLGSQHGCRFVEYQYVRASVEHLDDLYGLFLGYGHFINLLIRVDLEAISFSDLVHLG